MADVATDVRASLARLNEDHPAVARRIAETLGDVDLRIVIDGDAAVLRSAEGALRADPDAPAPTATLSLTRALLRRLARGDVDLDGAAVDPDAELLADYKLARRILEAARLYLTTRPASASEAAPARGWAEALARPVATIYGAGVTGLSLAHELVERGFLVQVVERAQDPERDGVCLVGGVAATQLARLPMSGSPPPFARTAPPRTVPQPLFFAPGDVGFDPSFVGPDGATNDARLAAIRSLLAELGATREDGNALRVEVVARVSGEDASVAATRARAVLTLLGEVAGVGLRGLVERGALEDRVELRVVEPRVPGEHGYRFFPSFYRNLSDVMRRTPLVETDGRPTGRSAYDALVPPERLTILTSDGREAALLRRRRPRSLEELRDLLRAFQRHLAFAPRDVALFQVRMLRYMTSSPRRRLAEAEPRTWRDYMGIDQFGERFREFLVHAPQALVAMSIDELDARTHGNFTVELMLDQLSDGEQVDLTLDGPTSSAWLELWKQHLVRQGVRFFAGELASLGVEGQRLVPRLRGPGVHSGKCGPTVIPEGSEAFLEDADYHVLAVPLEEVWHLTEALPSGSLGGDLRQLEDWRLAVADEARREGARQRGPDPLYRRPDLRPVGPFRDFPGLQFFFRSGTGFGVDGHAYFLGTPWGLSSISQSAHWRARRVLDRDGYLASISIDIGDVGQLGRNGRTLLECAPDEIAREVWAQITEGVDPTHRALLQLPTWYHLDAYWHHDGTTLLVNGAPYLINRPADWARRPGDIQPRGPADREGALAGPDGRRIRYGVSHGNWLVAGPHMKTFTRMATMEAANESARHAVNAILHDVATSRPGAAWRGRLLGDPCRTWDPEDHELEDLAPLRRLDEALMDRGLPHAFEILGLEAIAERAGDDALERLDDALGTLKDLGRQYGFRTPGAGVETLVRELRQWERRIRDAVNG